MDLVQLVFSPTGGTQKVADILAQEWGGAAQNIDLTDPQLDCSQINLSQEQLVLLAVPSYEGRVPALAAQRLSQIHGNRAVCVLLVVFGNRAFDDTLVELQDLALQADFQIVAAIAAVAEHSIFRQYGAGRPDDQDAAQLRRFAKQISEKMEVFQSFPDLKLPGNRPYHPVNGMPIAPKTAKSCTHCGLCARRCPAQAIRPDTWKTDTKACILCMRCVSQCPAGARKVNPLLSAVAGAAMKSKLSSRKENQLFD